METQYPLVFFTLFLCLCSGIMAIQGYLLMTGKGTKKFHMAALITELVALVIGGFSSFLHLHHWERIFNGFGHLTSGITQELIGIVVTVIVLIIIFVMLRKQKDDGNVAMAKWVGVVALVVGVIMGFVCAHSYYMPSRPAWANVMLYLYYYSSEFVLGAAGIWAVAAATGQDDKMGTLLARLTAIAGVVSAVVVVAAGLFYTSIGFYDAGPVFHTTDPTAAAADPTGTISDAIMGSGALMFWGGALVLGSIVAAVCGFLKMKKPAGALPYAVVALVCALIGGVCFRITLYAVGVAYFVYF